MNGAIAEPLVRTMSTPKPSRTTTSGRSQNFLRAPKKPRRSFRKSMDAAPVRSKRVFDVLAGERVIPRVHDRLAGLLEPAQLQRVRAHDHAAEPPERRHDDEEDGRQQDSRRHRA